MATILVTDGDARASLATVRSLGRSGYRVWVCSTRRRCLAGTSRFARGQCQVPDPLTSPDSFVQALEGLTVELGVEVLIPMTEASALAILAGRHRFRNVRIPLPDVDSFQEVSRKDVVLRTAEELGIKVPPQLTINAPEELKHVGVDSLAYPMVVKPARSVGESQGVQTRLSVRHAEDAGELALQIRGFSHAAYPLLLQRRVIGPGVGIFVLLWDGVLLAAFSHRRIREYPPSGGGSVYRESIPADPGLLRQSLALLERFHWHGVAMVEFKVDQATGTAYLMEINGRFWGSLQLAIDAGVDFPRILVEAALGQSPTPVREYRNGIRSRWWWGDVDHLLARIRHPAERLALPSDAPGRVRSVLDFLRLWWPGDRSEVFRLNDPHPFLKESLDWLSGRLR